MNYFRTTLITLYVVSSVVLLVVLVLGWEYYSLPVFERPHSPVHNQFKPSGTWGHGLGIIGSAMILLLFTYSARKRTFLGLRFGRMNRWLDIHIWFGIMGPLFITAHTAMKFHGIVSVSYFSMIAVMLSGFVGRYIYSKIPRDPAGMAMSMTKVDEKAASLEKILIDQYHVTPRVMQRLNRLSGKIGVSPHSQLGLLSSFIAHDIRRHLRVRKIRRFIHRVHPEIPPKALHQILSLAVVRSKLIRQKAFQGSLVKVFHLWHVVHKPFAYVMVIIMFFHIGLTIMMGYTWVF